MSIKQTKKARKIIDEIGRWEKQIVAENNKGGVVIKRT